MRIFKNIVALAVPLLALAMLSIPAAEATAIYTYKGNDFTQASSPYTTSDYLTITLTLASPLSPNITNLSDVTPQDLTMSDANSNVTLDSNAGASTIHAEVATDASGNINLWYFEMFGVPYIVASSHQCSTSGCGPSSDAITVLPFTQLASVSTNGPAEGTWTAPAPEEVPEPNSAPLLGTGLLGLVFLTGWKARRRRKAGRGSSDPV